VRDARKGAEEEGEKKEGEQKDEKDDMRDE
jgi:hypothetical protein